jgi:hypothetical protein
MRAFGRGAKFGERQIFSPHCVKAANRRRPFLEFDARFARIGAVKKLRKWRPSPTRSRFRARQQKEGSK